MLNEASNQPAYQSLCCRHVGTLHRWLSKMYPSEDSDKTENAQVDLNLRWAHMSKGKLSHTAALSSYIMKTCFVILTPQTHFYIGKMGFAGVYIIFLISAIKHGLWVPVRTALMRQF